MSIIHSCGFSRRKATQRGFWLLVFLSATIALTPQPTYSYQQEVEALSSRLAESISKSGKKTVAVVDFTDLQGNVTQLGRFLAEEFSVALAGRAEGFEVIDRTHLKVLLEEHKLASTGLIDPQTARKLGQVAGVEALVTGTITPLDFFVRVSVKVLDTSTARMISVAAGNIRKTRGIEQLLASGLGSRNQAAAAHGSSARATPRSAAITADDNDFVFVY